MGVNARFDGYTSPARLLRFARAIAAVLTASRYRVPRNDCKSAQKRLQTYIGRHCRLRKVVIDNGCVIPEGMQIGFDAAEDARRFFRTDSGVVLVTRDMLDRLAAEPAA